MKRLISVLLCIVMLASLFACGQVNKPPVEPDPPSTVSPTPEQPTGEPDPTPTVSPTPEVTPPAGIIHPVDGYQIVYENEELGVTICSVDTGDRIVVHYGELTQEIENFPYNDMRPGFGVLEQDGDGDGTNELYIFHTVGSGTGVYVEKLLVCEPNGDTLDCLVHDWNGIAEEFHMSRVASYDPVTGLVSVIYGEQALAICTFAGINCKDPAVISDDQVNYTNHEDGTVYLSLGLAMTSNDYPMSEFYGMELTLSLRFDGTDMVPVTEPTLGIAVAPVSYFGVTPTHVHKEYPENWYGEFLLTTPVGERSFSGLQVIEDITRMELHLADLTGDGVEEFIVMLVPGYGTGPIKHDLHIFDGVTLEEYDVSDVWSILSEVTAFASDDRHYYIDAANVLVSVSKEDAQNELADVLDALGQTELLDTMEFFSVYSRLSASGGKLFLSNDCVVIDPWYSYGSLTAVLVIKDGKLAVDEVFYTAPDGTVINERQTATYFHNLLHNGAIENWYLAAMGSIYENPTEMDLGLVFYGGFNPGDPGWGGFTAAEEAYLLEQGFYRNMSVQKMPAERLDEILNTYFGISLYDVSIPADWVYYPETDCYYSNHNDAYLVHGFTIMDVVETEDGLFELHYYVDPLHGAFDPVTGWPVVYGILTLRSNSGALVSSEGYTVISNRSAQPIDALVEEGVFLYALPDGQLIMQDGYVAGPVTYVNDANTSTPGCYDLSLITITQKEFLHDWEGEPLYEVILLNLLGGEPTENVELRWVEETGTWEVSFRASNQPDLGGEVTQDTIPTDPKQFYRVANCGVFVLYARNHGLESLLTWEGNFWWYLGERTAHTGHFNLPVMIPMDDHYEGVMDSVAVISEVQTGTQTGVDELIVYQVADIQAEDGSWYMGLKDHVYDWRPIAEEFNRSNTIVYDKDTNSLVLYWNDEVLFTGALFNDLSAHYDLEDGFTGALIASGQIVRYEVNEDGSFTVTMQTCIGLGGNGYFSDDLSDPFWHRNGEENYYYDMSAGVTGFELSWTVNFTGDGFEASNVSVHTTGNKSDHLADLFLSALNNTTEFTTYTIAGNVVEGTLEDVIALDPSFRITDIYALDLDVDGVDEILLDVSAGETPYGTMILHYDRASGKLFGCLMWIRAFMQPRVDGTFEYSDSSAEGGVARLTFTGSGFEAQRIAHTESVGGSTVNYYVNQQPSTKSEYNRVLSSHRAKDHPKKTTYTAEAAESLVRSCLDLPGGETILLRAALPGDGIYLFRSLGGGNAKDYLLVDRQVSVLESNLSFGDLIADFRLYDLDGDGEEEIAVVGNFYAGAGYTSILTILDKTENGWSSCSFFPSDAAYGLMETASFMPGADSNHVILSLDSFQFMFEVSDEIAARDGTYFASSTQLSTAITWDGTGYTLHLPGQIYRNDSSIEGFYPSACDIYFELRCRLEYDGNGNVTQVPIGITPPYTHFTVNQLKQNLFELVSEQGIVQFEGTHIPGEALLTDRRDLDLDGAEEFIVLLASGQSANTVHHDVYIFDGRTLEQVDTSDLWSIGTTLFVFFSDSEMFHIHSGEFRQPLYKEDILARYPDIEFLDKVEFWGEHSSVSVMYDYIEVSYDCIVGEGGESFGALQVHLKVENGQLIPYWIVYAFEGQTTHHQLASNPIPGPFIGE